MDATRTTLSIFRHIFYPTQIQLISKSSLCLRTPNCPTGFALMRVCATPCSGRAHPSVTPNIPGENLMPRPVVKVISFFQRGTTARQKQEKIVCSPLSMMGYITMSAPAHSHYLSSRPSHGVQPM